MGVRRAAVRDAARVAELWCALTEHHRGLDPSFALGPGQAAAATGLLEGLVRDPDAELLVWEDEGRQLLGFCSARIARAAPPALESQRGEIVDLLVRAGARRRGIGRALVEAASTWLRQRGARRIEVRVAHANAEGQAFWRALGYADLVDVLHRRL